MQRLQSWRQRLTATEGELPIYNPVPGIGRRETQSWSFRSAAWKYKLVHLIPLTILLCFIILWFFSSPVDVEIKDGNINSIPRIKKQLFRRSEKPDKGKMDVDLTILALENPPDKIFSVSDAPKALLLGLHEPMPNASSLVSHGPSLSSPVQSELNTSFSAPLDEQLVVTSKEAVPHPGGEG